MQGKRSVAGNMRPACRQTDRRDDYLSRGGKRPFAGAAAICSADSDVSTSTRRVAGSVLTVALAHRESRIVFYRTGAAAAGHVINMELHSVNSLCGNCICQSGPCQCWKVSVISGLTDALPVRGDEDGAIPPVRASGSLSSELSSVCGMGQSGGARRRRSGESARGFAPCAACSEYVCPVHPMCVCAGRLTSALLPRLVIQRFSR